MTPRQSELVRANPSSWPLWLLRIEVALILRMSEKTIDRRIADGSLEAKRIGGAVRIHRDALRRFIDGTGGTKSKRVARPAPWDGGDDA